MATGFPSSLDFTMKKNAVQTATNTQVHFPITGSTANPQDVINFNLSTGKYGQYLDPAQIYISFTLKNLDTATAIVVDGSAYSVFDRIVVLSSGSVVSDLQYFGAYAQMMLDTQVGVGKNTTMSTFAGSANDPSLNILRTGASIAANGAINVSLPLMGTAIDASSCDKLIPVGAISDLQLQFYISNIFNAITGATTGNWQLQNLALTATYVTLDAGAQKMLDDAQGGVYKWSGEQFKGYSFNLNSGSGGDNVFVPFKGSSAKSVYAIQRPAANMNNNAALANVSRVNSYAKTATQNSSWFITIGSDTYPRIPIKNSTMHVMELLKSYHALGAPSALQTSLDTNNWVATDGTCSFVAALNLEAYSNKSNTIHSGVSVLGGTNLTLNQTYASNLSAAMLQTTYVHFDCIYSIDNGVLSCAF